MIKCSADLAKCSVDLVAAPNVTRVSERVTQDKSSSDRVSQRVYFWILECVCVVGGRRYVVYILGHSISMQYFRFRLHIRIEITGHAYALALLSRSVCFGMYLPGIVPSIFGILNHPGEQTVLGLKKCRRGAWVMYFLTTAPASS